jgi:hypothetical protein
MLWTSRRKTIVKTIANRKCPIPNEGGFRSGSLLSMAALLLDITVPEVPLWQPTALAQSTLLPPAGRRIPTSHRQPV